MVMNAIVVIDVRRLLGVVVSGCRWYEVAMLH